MLQFADISCFLLVLSYIIILLWKVFSYAFELWFGLQINFNKTNIGDIGVSDKFLFRCVELLNCNVINLPFTYLEVPIGGHIRKQQTWLAIIEKIKIKLSKWKGKHMSIAERVCLLKTIIFVVSLYYMSFFKIPTSVVKEIKKI